MEDMSEYNSRDREGPFTSRILHQLMLLKLRHLQRIVACNIELPNGDGLKVPVPPSSLPTIQDRLRPNFGYFLSLHVSPAPECAAFYTSELSCSPNPRWAKLHLISQTPNHIHTAKGLIVRVWYKPLPSTELGDSKQDDAVGDRENTSGSALNRSSSTNVKESSHKDDSKIVTNNAGIVMPRVGDIKASSKPVLTHSLSSPINIDPNDSSTSLNPSTNLQNRATSRHLRTMSYSPSPSAHPARITPKSNSFEPSECPIIPPTPQPRDCENNSSEPILVFSWAVHLSGLVPIGRSAAEASPYLSPNTLIFQLAGDMLYTSADNIVSAIPELYPADTQVWYDIHLPLSQTKRSYTPLALTKLHQSERDVSVLESRCEGRHERLDYIAKLKVNDKEQQLREKIAAVKSRIRTAKTLVEKEKQKLKLLKNKVEETEVANQEKGMHVLSLVQCHGRERQHLRSACCQTAQQHLYQLNKARSLLARRRSHLIKDLAHIYPIVQIGLKDEFSICDIWIPDAQLHNNNNLQTPNFQVNRSKPIKGSAFSKSQSNKTLPPQQASSVKVSPSSSPKAGLTPKSQSSGALSPLEGMQQSRFTINPAFHPSPQTLSTGLPHSVSTLSAGLGMVTHLMCLVSGLLQVPLKYPMSPVGSVATVNDVATVQLPQDNRNFPLYTRGKEKEKLHFNYGVFLLNKNIAQLLHYLGRPKSAVPSATLPNLYSVLMHLIREDISLVAELPDLKCQPLIISPMRLELMASGITVPTNASSPLSNAEVSSTPHHHHPNASPQSSPYQFSSPNHRDRSCSVLHQSCSVAQLQLHSYNAGPPTDSDVPSDGSTPRSTTNECMHPPRAPAPSSSYEGTGRDTPPQGRLVLCKQSSVSYSLDKGLDTIKDIVVSCAADKKNGSDSRETKPGVLGGRDMDPFTMHSSDVKSFLKQRVSGSLTNLYKDHSLTVAAGGGSIDFEDMDEGSFKDDTTTLLRSWQEDTPSNCSNAVYFTCGDSMEQLHEVGVEATENFRPSESRSDDTLSLLSHADDSGSYHNDAICNATPTNKELVEINIIEPTPPATVTQVNSEECPSKDMKSNVKTKSRKFWPFSRSNTSESSRESVVPNDKNVAASSCDVTDSRPDDSTQTPVQNNVDTNIASPHADTILSSTPKPNSSDAGDDLSSSADELLKESLAALSPDCQDDLQKLSYQTAQLASKNISFKLGAK